MSGSGDFQPTALVTGATGLLGSHIAEQRRRRGHLVRALCRPNANGDFLKSTGVDIVTGGLKNVTALRRACEGVDAIYHAAARVGDGGPWREFVQVTGEETIHPTPFAPGEASRREPGNRREAALSPGKPPTSAVYGD